MAAGDSRSFQNHVELGSFSVDENERYYNDLRNRRFFVEPSDERPDFDILQGIDEFNDIQRQSVATLEDLLTWIRDNRETLDRMGILTSQNGGIVKKLDVDFVARRGVLGHLLCAAQSPYKVDIFVTLCNGTYYIETARLPNYGFRNYPTKLNAYAGKKFLSYVTSVDGNFPDPAQPVVSDAPYYSVMKARCGKHSILVSSEIQAERQQTQQRPPKNYVSIKTNFQIRDANGRKTFNRDKTLRWWSQAHITGIPEILCGWRDDEGHVIARTELMRTEDLPRKAEGFWTPRECLDKFHSLLDDIKRKIQDDDPNAVYHLELEEYEKSRGVKHRLKTREFIDRGIQNDDYVIVKDWYRRDVLGME